MTVRITTFFVAMLFVAFSCSTKKEEKPDAEVASHEWKEMDQFHMVMAEVFHPYKDSSDLKPAKEMAGELTAAANDWKRSEIPAHVDKEKVSEKLERLTALSAELEKEVGSQSEEVIGEKLTVLHDLFHELQNDFYEATKEHKHDH